MADAVETDPLHAPTMVELGPTDPEEVGPYRLIGRLGHGGMGIAYLGECSGRYAVLKVLGQGAPLKGEDIARWERELDAMRAAASDRTVRLFDHDFVGRPPWFAMEFVPGHTLQQQVEAAGPLPPEALTPFALGLAEALLDIHAADVVHRDLKHSNIMLSTGGPRIIDFGVAALADATMLTKTGSIVGTVGWLAPEQITHDAYSAATDVHAWGLCVLYASTGHNPYAAEAPGAAIYKILHETPETPELMPRRLARMVSQALAKDPLQRPELAQIVALLSVSPDDTGEIDEDDWKPPAAAPPRRRRGIVLAATVAVVVGVGAGVVVGRLLAGVT